MSNSTTSATGAGIIQSHHCLPTPVVFAFSLLDSGLFLSFASLHSFSLLDVGSFDGVNDSSVFDVTLLVSATSVFSGCVVPIGCLAVTGSFEGNGSLVFISISIVVDASVFNCTVLVTIIGWVWNNSVEVFRLFMVTSLLKDISLDINW